MPWKVVPDDAKAKGPFKVISKITGKVAGTHKTHAQATSQLQALYANVPEATKRDAEGNEWTVQVVRVDEDKGQLFGWAYVTRDKDGNEVIDRKGASCPTEVLEEAVYDFVLHRRVASDMHEKGDRTPTEPGGIPIQHGTLIETVVFTREKMAAMGIPPGILPEGWWFGAQMDKASEGWQAYKRGDRSDFSIRGEAFAEYLE